MIVTALIFFYFWIAGGLTGLLLGVHRETGVQINKFWAIPLGFLWPISIPYVLLVKEDE